MTISKVDARLPSKPDKSNEKDLAEIVKELVSTQESIIAVLDEVAKVEPRLDAITGPLDRQRKISEKGRAAELKDLEKAAKRGELHTNPSKLERLIKDFNEDVTSTNALEGGVDGALAAHFADEIKKLGAEIEEQLPKGVKAADIGLAAHLEAFKKRNAKERWAKFSKRSCETFSTERLDEAEKTLRTKTIAAFVRDDDFSLLKLTTREKIVQKALKGDDSPAEVRKELEDAFELQDKPSRQRWSTYLGLGARGSYNLIKAGAYRGSKIHITMSTASWTADSEGKVSISANSANEIFEKLLKVTDWMQLHATLEVGADSRAYPHVFLFAGVLANDTKWEAARAAKDLDADWVTGAQNALISALATFSAGLIAKIKKGKEISGPMF